MLEIKVKMHADIEPPATITGGDWVDLRAAEDVEMEAGEYRVISLGVSIMLPDGYEAHIVPRSSTFNRLGVLLVNGMGIIDNSYAGDRCMGLSRSGDQKNDHLQGRPDMPIQDRKKSAGCVHPCGGQPGRKGSGRLWQHRNAVRYETDHDIQHDSSAGCTYFNGDLI